MNKKILFIEDDSFLQGLAASKLQKDGFAVRAASNSDEAMKLLAADTPDLILSDLVIPGVDGFGIMEMIRKNPATAKTPLIVFSNLSEDKDIQRAKDLGANEYMVKSNFTLDELSQKIKDLLK